MVNWKKLTISNKLNRITERRRVRRNRRWSELQKLV